MLLFLGRETSILTRLDNNTLWMKWKWPRAYIVKQTIYKGGSIRLHSHIRWVTWTNSYFVSIKHFIFSKLLTYRIFFKHFINTRQCLVRFQRIQHFYILSFLKIWCRIDVNEKQMFINHAYNFMFLQIITTFLLYKPSDCTMTYVDWQK